MPGSIFSDPPSTPNSGPTLPRKCVIQHRSESLFKDQIENVKNTQASLKKILIDISNCRDEIKLNEMYRNAEVLKRITDEEVVKLQVIRKINDELLVARRDLDLALRGLGNRSACRKRVMWLEGRIEFIMGRQRMKNDCTGIVNMPHGGLDHFRIPSPDHSSCNGSSQEFASEEGDIWYQEKLAVTEERMKLDSRCTDVSQRSNKDRETSGHSGSVDNDDVESENCIELSIQGNSAEKNINGNFNASNVCVDDVEKGLIRSVADLECKNIPEASNNLNISNEEFVVNGPRSQDEVRGTDVKDTGSCASSVGNGDPPLQRTSSSAPTVIKTPVGDLDMDSQEIATLPQRPATHTTDIPLTHTTDHPAKRRSVTVTSPKSKEVTDLGSVREEKSSEPHDKLPSDKSPRDKLPSDKSPRDKSPRDKSLEYWSSEHHRLEFCPSSHLICGLDPLSYHQMGLAVPGSFLPKVREVPKVLPWRDVDQPSDIQDIHKVALNKLCGRIQDISDRVFDAVDLSTNATVKEEPVREHSFIQSLDLSSSNDESSIIRKLSMSDQCVNMDAALDVKLPKLENRRLGTSGSGRVVFYPNPIPPPQTLPITRVNRNKVYPRAPGTFCDSPSTERLQVVRVADQRNLYEETKLTLYQDKDEGYADGNKSTELRLRCLLDESRDSDRSCISSTSTRLSSVTTPGSYPIKRYSSQKTKSHFTALRAIAAMKAQSNLSSQGTNWKTLKPRSNTLDHSGLKWERVKTIAHVNLVSERVEERRDAARHLGLLRCGDAMVCFALKQRLALDEDSQVRLEAAKSLILIGCWEEEILFKLVQYLIYANSAIRSDIITTVMEGRNIQYVNKTTPVFGDLVTILSRLTHDSDDVISFNAAVLIGKLCIVDEDAKRRLLLALESSGDTHVKSKALEILVKYMHTTDWAVVTHIFDQLRKSPVWKYRALAAKLLILIGSEHVCADNREVFVYEQLETRLWDDPVTAVRMSVAKAITALNMLPRAMERVEKKLEDPDEEKRAQAVISLGTLGMRNEKFLRSLLEMLELDSSEYVRLMILRTFGTLELSDKRVIRVLKEKEKLDGNLAKSDIP